MRPFAFARPGSLAEALELLAEHADGAALMAGGTSLMLLLKAGLQAPAVVIGLAGVPELHGVEPRAGGGVRIGALAGLHELETSALLRARWPALAEAFGQVATIRIRDQATLGGNLVHADPAQDPPPALLVHDASVELAGPAGRRIVPLEGFFRDVFETVVGADEILTAVELPAPDPGDRGTYVKFLPGSVDDWATVSVATRLRLAPSGRVDEARVALGGVASTPVRAIGLEDALAGQEAGAIVRRAGELAALVDEVLDPVDDARGSAAYKREMARVWTARALVRSLGAEARVA